MENENPGLGGHDGNISDEDLLGVRNRGKKARKSFTDETAGEPGESSKKQERGRSEPKAASIEPPVSFGAVNNDLAEKLDKLRFAREATQIRKTEVPTPAVKEQVEPKENPLTILEGIGLEETIPGILKLVRKAYENETTDEAKSDYTLILDTLERIIKKTNEPDGEVDQKLIDKLSEKFSLKNTVKKILGFDKKIIKSTEESPKQALNTKDQMESQPINNTAEPTPEYVSGTPETYDEERINEVKTFVNKSMNNMSVRAIMEEFALDEETAKNYLAASLGATITPKEAVVAESTNTPEEKAEKIEETPEQILSKISEAKSIDDILDLVKQAGGITNTSGLFVSPDDMEANLIAIEEQADIYNEHKDEAMQKEAAGEEAPTEFILAKNILKNRYLKLLTHKYGLRDKVREILGLEELSSSNIDVDNQENKEEKAETVLSDEKIAELSKSFDTPGFLEFLAKHPDANFDIEDTANAEKVLKLHEAFLVKNEVSKEMSNVVSEELSNLVGVGDKESLASLESYINSQTYEDPEKVLEFKKQIDILKGGQKQIIDLQKQIAEKTAELPLGKITTDEEADLEMLNTTMDASFIGPAGRKIINMFAETGKIVETLREISKNDQTEGRLLRDIYSGGVVGFKTFFIDVPYALYQLTRINSKENKVIKTEARGKIEKITGEKYSGKTVGKYLEKISEQKTKSAELNQLGKEISVSNTAYDVYKKFVATDMMKIEGVTEDAGKKIKSALGKILESKNFDLNTSEEAQNLLEKVQSIMGGNESLDFLSEDDVAKLQEEIDKKAQEVILKQIQNAFEVGKKVKSPFSNIEKSLKNILEKNKIGSKEGTDVRKLMKDSLVIVAKKFNDPIMNIKIKAFILTNKL